jgi:hypothetical protein
MRYALKTTPTSVRVCVCVRVTARHCITCRHQPLGSLHFHDHALHWHCDALGQTLPTYRATEGEQPGSEGVHHPQNLVLGDGPVLVDGFAKRAATMGTFSPRRAAWPVQWMAAPLQPEGAAALQEWWQRSSTRWREFPLQWAPAAPASLRCCHLPAAAVSPSWQQSTLGPTLDCAPPSA